MENPRPRFKLPIAVEKISFEPAPPMMEMLENILAVAPIDVEGPEIGRGVRGKRDRVREPLIKKAKADDYNVFEAPVVVKRPELPDDTKFTLKDFEVVIGEKKFLHKDGQLYEIRDRESNENYDPDEEWTFESWQGPAVKNEYQDFFEFVVLKKPRKVVKELPEEPVSSNIAKLQGRIEKEVTKDMAVVRPPLFVPSNRRLFKQFIIQSFSRYFLEPPPKDPNPNACQEAMASSKEVKTFSYQAFVRDYIQRPSPYRGVLVYHGLGSGKTCTSIAAMEALTNKGQKPIYIMTPASLSKNYRDEITKCGPFIFRTNNYWHWIPIDKLNSALLDMLGMPEDIPKKQKGLWVPDPARMNTPNFDTFSPKQQAQIVQQIYQHIDGKFQFINYNGLTESKVKSWICDTPRKFDGATVVIDEVHNLIRTINNSELEKFYKEEPRTMANFELKNCATGRKYKLSYIVYRMLCNAVGCKIVALSGTPIINYPHELGILSNLLAGDTRMVEATYPKLEGREKLLAELNRHPEVDFAEVLPRQEFSTSTVRITPVPSGCRKVVDEKTGEVRGFVRDTTKITDPLEITREFDLAKWFERVAAGKNIKDPKFMSISRLPDIEKPFEEMFVDKERLVIKPEVRIPLMARLSGLISYYKGGKADLMAKVTTDEVVTLEMSDLQLKEYTDRRTEEIEREQKDKKKPAAGPVKVAAQGPSLYDQVVQIQNSTFKIFSRAACNFAFPADMDRPRPADYRDAARALGVAAEDATGDEQDDGMEKAPKAEVKHTQYEEGLKAAVAELRARAAEFFTKENLPKYSPKFQAIIDRLENSRGPALVYSQFKTLEGIGLFSLSLETQKGYRRFDIVPSGKGEWRLSDETKAGGADVPRYITYTGDEDAEKRNMLKAIFNAAWGKMPSGLVAEIKALLPGVENNQQGKIAKIFMITQSGAEGISLANVRQVHIMEPYWNYVRLEQVKGRAIRICSHMDLPLEERTVDVYTYIVKFGKRQIEERIVDETLLNFDGGVTTDESIITLSNNKKKLADSIFDVMIKSAVDCEINAAENGTVGCYRIDKGASMNHLFHPIVQVDLREQSAIRAL